MGGENHENPVSYLSKYVITYKPIRNGLSTPEKMEAAHAFRELRVLSAITVFGLFAFIKINAILPLWGYG